jgi:hypothetical protein
MDQIFLWLGGIFSIIYGSLTAFAGYGQTRIGKIQIWAAWLFILFGLTVVGAGVIVFLHSGAALWVLLIGLLGIHGLAINNGWKMHGRINPSHHLGRLVISIVLLALTYLGLK